MQQCYSFKYRQPFAKNVGREGRNEVKMEEKLGKTK